MHFLSFLSFSITTLQVVLATKTSASDFPATIWTSSSDGTISTLQLTYTNDSYQLTKIATSTACSDSPSWLTYSTTFQNLYCVGHGSLKTLSVGKDGSLTSQSSSRAIDGGVNAIIYHANTSNFIALAHYDSGAISTWSLTGKDNLPEPLQNLTFSNGTDMNLVSHPAQVIVDPSGKFILSPDHGLDTIHVLSIQPDTGLLQTCPNITVDAGSGPRHAAFASLAESNNTFLFLVSENANTVTSFEVVYQDGCMSMTELEQTGSMGWGKGSNETRAADIAVVNSSVIVSNRYDRYSTPYHLVNDPYGYFSANVSDSMVTYIFNFTTGNFTSTQVSAAGGSVPLQFAVNKAGDLLAVGLQGNGTVAILKRDPTTGGLQDGPVASLDGLGNITCTIWDE